MRIITWNCNMAFRKKAEHISAYKPDIVIVPECECPDRLIFNASVPTPTDLLWFGANKHKGLAVFSYSSFKFKALECHNEAFKMVVPIAVTSKAFNFTLFAVWANNPKDVDGQYVEQVWKAIHYYDSLLSGAQTILAGDFNSNTIWDRKRRAGNHSNVVKYLEEKGIYSAYHLHYKQLQGTEQHPTFYLYRDRLKPYHLDYCFMSGDLIRRIQSVEVGEHAFWAQYSDHVPLIVTLNTVLP